MSGHSDRHFGRHLCACMYNASGVCIWCGSSEPAIPFKPRIDQTIRATISESLGSPVRSRLIPYFDWFKLNASQPSSSWARSNILKTASKIAGVELTDDEELNAKAVQEFEERIKRISTIIATVKGVS